MADPRTQTPTPIFTPLSDEEMDVIESASAQKSANPSSYASVMGSSPAKPANSSHAYGGSDYSAGYGQSDESSSAYQGGHMHKETSAGHTSPTSVPLMSSTVDTLDEPVSVTIMRDLKAIWHKLKRVCFPRGDKNLLKDWDLWGPLLLCLALSIMLSIRAQPDQMATVFTLIFVIVWCGAAVVTLNSKLLGGKLSLFQSLCVLGYCIFPLCIAALVKIFVKIMFIRAIVSGVAFVWSTLASVGFLSDVRLQQRRLLAIYPVCLFYFVIAWMLIIS